MPDRDHLRATSEPTQAALTARLPPRAVAAEPRRSAHADDPLAAARVARERTAQPNGWWGMALFMCAEATLFGGLIATYFYLNFGARSWPPPGIAPPATLAPSVLTAILVATSVPMAFAARRARAGARASCAAAIAVAMALQCGYVAYQLHLLVDELHKFTPRSGGAYGSIYYTLLAIHHAHVIVGILLGAGMLLWLARSGLTNYRLTGVRTLALYWHVVNVLAVAVLLTQLSPAL